MTYLPHDPGTMTPGSTLAELAATIPAASRVFLRHRLDFCCQGERTLADACATRGVAPERLIAEITAEIPRRDDRVWNELRTPELIEHLSVQFHDPLRRELPRLHALLDKVNRVHGAHRPELPALAQRFARFVSETIDHLDKEEQVLFPAILSGEPVSLAGPLACLRREHDAHGKHLAALRELTHDYQPPAEACASYRALYLGLGELAEELMRHIHIENHVLFPRVQAA